MNTMPSIRHKLEFSLMSHCHPFLVYYFSTAIVTNYYNISSLIDTNLLSYNSVVLEFDMGFTRPKSRCKHRSSLFWRFYETFCFLALSSF